jgi:hypothetical protein
MDSPSFAQRKPLQRNELRERLRLSGPGGTLDFGYGQVASTDGPLWCRPPGERRCERKENAARFYLAAN